MTEKTTVFTARVPKEVIDIFDGIDKRKALETLTKWLVEGDVSQKDGQLTINRSVYTEEKNVYTNDCAGCEYFENALDMSKFNEVCEYRGLDRQKALDRSALMLWGG